MKVDDLVQVLAVVKLDRAAERSSARSAGGRRRARWVLHLDAAALLAVVRTVARPGRIACPERRRVTRSSGRPGHSASSAAVSGKPKPCTDRSRSGRW